MYLRFADKVLNENWKPEVACNKVILKKIR
jgi:hypothetical protein